MRRELKDENFSRKLLIAAIRNQLTYIAPHSYYYETICE